MRSLRPFLRYFPRAAWLILVAALVLRYLLPGFHELFNMVVSFCLIYFLAKVATFIHEAGHLIVGYWVGGTPKRMILGWGYEVHRTTWKNIKIVLKSNPMGGVAMAIFKEMPWLRLRFAAYVLGGVFFNVLAAALVYFLFGYRSDFIMGEQGIDVASAFIFVNAITLVNLVPLVSSIQGYPQPTDGLMLLQTIFLSREKNFKGIEFAEEYFQIFEHMEDGNDDQAHELSLRLQQKSPNDINVLSLLASVQIKKLHLDEALQNLKRIEEEMNTKKHGKKRGLIFNSIAWIHLMKNDINEAYYYATQAINLLPKSPYVAGTYGSILVERGDIDIGIQWLVLLSSKTHINNETLSASIYLALAYHLKDDSDKRDWYVQLVTENVDKLSKDSLLLWDRCKQKIQFEVSA